MYKLAPAGWANGSPPKSPNKSLTGGLGACETAGCATGGRTGTPMDWCREVGWACKKHGCYWLKAVCACL